MIIHSDKYKIRRFEYTPSYNCLRLAFADSCTGHRDIAYIEKSEVGYWCGMSPMYIEGDW